ncbi:hypothetical protein D1871_23450 [Nakamurella silvestris]|nr:hypothetical protein D1871_23450 [Nakamurella silvestris]
MLSCKRFRALTDRKSQPRLPLLEIIDALERKLPGLWSGSSGRVVPGSLPSRNSPRNRHSECQRGQFMHPSVQPRRSRRRSLPLRRAGAGVIAAAMMLGIFGGASPAGAAVVDVSAAATPLSPVIAADAPWTKTVSWLVSQLTPAEKVLIVEKSTDPDAHGQAGYLAPVARLGIPEIRHVDAMGINVRADTTAFPNRLGLASSFDRDAYVDLGVQTGVEGLAADVDLIYGPQVDMARTPSWPRNMTTNGEDAYLSAEFSATEINAIQSTGLLSQVKHVSMYNGQDQNVPSLVSSQAAHEVYLAPAQSAIQQGGVSSLMCSYAKFQIVSEQDQPYFACSNNNLMNNIVKGEFGLKGFITSDYGGSKATSDILAGMDNEFSTSNLSSANLKPLIDTTSSTYNPLYAAATDNSVARILYQYERFGLLDNSKIPAAYRSDVAQHGNVAVTDNSVHIDKTAGSAVALSLAEKAAVLLKNDNGALPLSTTKKVAVVGPTATLMPVGPGGERSRGFGDRNTFTPLKAIQTAAGPANVISAPGVDWYGTPVPAANLQTTNDGTAVPGLVRTTVDTANATTVSTDTTLNGKQTNLVRGNKYTWTGYLNVTAADTYQLLVQRPYGTDNSITTGNNTVYNKGVTQASAGTVSVAIDGVNQTLANPSNTILQNDVPDGDLAANGQYLGKDNTGVSLPLTAGLHQVTLTYNPTLNSATTPTFRFAWAPLNQNIAAAVAAAQTADETVIFVDDSAPGANAGNGAAGAGVKPMNVNQVNLVNAVSAAAHAAGHKVAVVVNSASAVQLNWAANVDAILEMWYPGQEGGTATANLLYGKTNPSGKLPITFPKDDASTPFAGHPERVAGTQDSDETVLSTKWTDGVDVGYRWYTDPAANTTDVKPLYAFGHGLSYTSFAYSGLTVKNAADGGLDVTFTVTNTGTKAGGEAAQVYLGASPDLAAPVYNSKGLVVDGFQQSALKLVQFAKVQLAPGAAKTQTLHVDVQQLSGWSTVGQNWVLGTGDRVISLAAASDDIKLTATKKISAGLVAPAITTDLAADTSAAVGSTVTLTAAASGTPAPAVQWQVSTDKGVTYNDIAGATAASLVVQAPITASGNTYRAVFTNDLGTATTAATTLHVTFTDGTATAFGADIQWLADNRITTGNPDGTFGPAQNISRQALIAWLWRYTHPGQTDPTVTVAPFSDVPANTTFAGAIAWAKAAGITTGTNGKFDPGASITRQDVAIFVYRALNGTGTIPACTTVPFPDVSKNAPSCGAIAWLKANHITTGWTDGTFKPALPIARDAVAAWLHRASQL